ncbi:DUF2871 domain-containing protein [Facklamia miroungae]|uniref:DUF2871 domain-containing protein n=1 Tax=Facklamia miroungae TaxID=120956 RepID=A0A1G7QBV5_9LACT|nr:DUF2871 domain-containing protein [Facklamia miroungae]NKZ28876.1 DUF2871 domain-containing protein [Facklamia miroungae]SDF95399.1 Protein of unknown function [Facklamia miroungae]
MKKYIDLSIFYFVLAMISGVFYREFYKFMDFRGDSTLGTLHVHLMVLGVLVFLLVIILAKLFPIEQNKNMKRFMIVYNVGLLMLTATLTTRGIVQVNGIALSAAANGALSGIAGLSHILLAIGWLFLLLILRKTITNDIDDKKD